jgi:hypothetical protein
MAPGATAPATLAVSDALTGNNCQHQVQVTWVQVYPPDQYKALFAHLSRPGCADQSLVTMGVTAYRRRVTAHRRRVTAYRRTAARAARRSGLADINNPACGNCYLRELL